MTEHRRFGVLRTHRGRRWVLLVGMIAAAVAVIGVSLVAIQERADTARVEAKVSAENAQSVAEQVHIACAEQGVVAERLGDLCRQAEQIVEQPAAPVVVAPSEEQLRPLVREYVAGWLAQNPPQSGRDGRTPTAAEIAAIVAVEVAAALAADPPPQGPQGEPGRAPTVAELQPIVAQEVGVWLAANPPAPGEPGEDGVDGQPGPVGSTGPAGVDGEDGEPPESWTYTHCDVLGCTDYLCTRDASYTPEVPTYECASVEG